MSLELKDVEHVARLARLALSEAEKAQMATQLTAILDYIQKLRELPTDGVEPTAHAVPLRNVMREDDVRPCLDREAMMASAPERADEFFRVPRILED
jgi:aspartyl-tRNA(Asn)/glutamyl-tRNA(Gln) amidotransferase subunit C